MSELLFECYGVPSVAYGIDALFSAHYNFGIKEGTDALIISSGHQTTYILPVLNGQLDSAHCKRYAQSCIYLWRHYPQSSFPIFPPPHPLLPSFYPSLKPTLPTPPLPWQSEPGRDADSGVLAAPPSTEIS